MKAIELSKRLAENKAITVNLRYTGKGGNARKFAEEMTAGGTVAAIRAEAGNLRYEYYQSLDDPETILLIDSWENQDAIDVHHASPMMAAIAGGSVTMPRPTPSPIAQASLKTSFT